MPDAYGSSGTIQGTTPTGDPLVGNPVPAAGVTSGGDVVPILVSSDGTVHTTGGGGGGSSVYITNQAGTHSLDVAADGSIAVTQDGTWNVGVTGTVAATQSGTWTTGRTWTLASGTDSVTTVPSGTQTITGTVTANLGTLNGAATAANQTNVQSAPGTPQTTALTIQGNASGVAVPVSIGGTVTVSGTVAATQSGTWSVNQSGSWTVTLGAGSAVIGHVITDSGSTTVVTGNVTVVQPTGTNLHAVIDSGTVAISAGSAVIGHVITDSGSTTAVTGNVTVVQGTGTNLHTVVDSSALPTGAATDASVTGLQVSQGSTTSGQKGGLVLGAVTTSNPTYTTGQSSPLSLATDGSLRVSGTVTAGNASVSATGSAVPASATMVGGTDGTNLRALSVSTTGVLNTQHVDTAPATGNVTAQDTASTTTTGANSQSIITGTPTANSAVSFALTAQDTVNVQVTGTWTGTLSPEISMDGGTTWYTRGVHQYGTSYTSSSFTANFAGLLSVAGVTNFRVRATAAMTGTATVRVTESLNQAVAYIANSLMISDGTVPSQRLAIDASGRITVNVNGTVPVSGTVTANIGTTNGLALDATQTNGTAKSQVVSSGGNALAVDSAGNAQIRGGFTEVSGSASALNADLIASMDVSAYKSISVHITAQASGGITTFQGSNDNSNWFSVSLVATSSAQAPPINAASSTGLYFGPIGFRYLRIRETSWTSGTASCIVELYTNPVSAVVTGGQVVATCTQSGTWTVQPGNTANTTPWLTTQRPATSGGSTLAKVLAASGTNATSTKASAGQLISIVLSNTSSSYRYFKFYNKASAPTVGTDTPVLTIGIPTGGAVAWSDLDGTPFSTGIAYAITTGFADNDTGAVTAGDVVGGFTYA